MPIRVLIVDDSLTVRKRIAELLSGDPEFEVAGEAADGKQGIEMCQALRPDVLSMDMMMPVMTGLSATEYLMAYCPTPILIVSASLNRGEALRTLDALAAGAVEVMDKPPADAEMDAAWERQYKSTLKLVSRIRPIPHLRAKLAPSPGSLRSRSHLEFSGNGTLSPLSPARGESTAFSLPPRGGEPTREARGERGGEGSYDLVAIGASTGGPQALMKILPELPPEFDLPILLIVHIDPRFDASFRDWLGGLVSIPVVHAIDGMAIPKRGVRELVLAPSDLHLVAERGRLRLSRTKERHSCRPSVDVLFESLAAEMGSRTIACLLTGMGADGAAGMLALRKAGGLTLAQDEASSVIFGMPAEAIKRGGASEVLSLFEFAPRLADLARAGAVP